MAGEHHIYTSGRWVVKERPGYLGNRKDELAARWNQQYGEGNWRLLWEIPNGEVWSFDQMFWQVYVPGYVKHFLLHHDQACFLTENYSYAYDRDDWGREAAFNPRAQYEQPGIPNQFHTVALNIALEWFLGMPFRGARPIQVRGPETEGGQWNPGHIATVRPDLLSDEQRLPGWWRYDEAVISVEEVYQGTKALAVYSLTS